NAGNCIAQPISTMSVNPSIRENSDFIRSPGSPHVSSTIRKLLEVDGFSFWSRLPRYHSGEEVLVQNLLMRRWGGCAFMPSGTYYAQVPSTVLNEAGTVDGHALDLLAEMIEKYTLETPGVKTFSHE